MSEMNATERAVLDLIVATRRRFAGRESYVASTADMEVARVVTDYFLDAGDGPELPNPPLGGINRGAATWWRSSAPK